MKRAKLGLLEVLGLVEKPAGGLCRRGAGILLSCLFETNRPFGFAIFSWADVGFFLRVDITFFLAGGHKALSRGKLYALSCGQLLRLCFLRAVLMVFAGH
jgi:hypothetical protein